MENNLSGVLANQGGAPINEPAMERTSVTAVKHGNRDLLRYDTVELVELNWSYKRPTSVEGLRIINRSNHPCSLRRVRGRRYYKKHSDYESFGSIYFYLRQAAAAGNVSNLNIEPDIRYSCVCCLYRIPNCLDCCFPCGCFCFSTLARYLFDVLPCSLCDAWDCLCCVTKADRDKTGCYANSEDCCKCFGQGGPLCLPCCLAALPLWTFIDAFSHWPCLMCNCVQECMCGTEHRKGHNITEFFDEPTRLRGLDLRGIDLSSDEIGMIGKYVETSTRLECLYIPDKGITESDQELLRKSTMNSLAPLSIVTGIRGVNTSERQIISKNPANLLKTLPSISLSRIAAIREWIPAVVVGKTGSDELDGEELDISNVQVVICPSSSAKACILSWRNDLRNRKSRNLKAALKAAKRKGFEFMYVDYFAITFAGDHHDPIQVVAKFSELYKTLPTVFVYTDISDMERLWLFNEVLYPRSDQLRNEESALAEVIVGNVSRNEAWIKNTAVGKSYFKDKSWEISGNVVSMNSSLLEYNHFRNDIMYAFIKSSTLQVDGIPATYPLDLFLVISNHYPELQKALLYSLGSLLTLEELLAFNAKFACKCHASKTIAKVALYNLMILMLSFEATESFVHRLGDYGFDLGRAGTITVGQQPFTVDVLLKHIKLGDSNAPEKSPFNVQTVLPHQTIPLPFGLIKCMKTFCKCGHGEYLQDYQVKNDELRVSAFVYTDEVIIAKLVAYRLLLNKNKPT